MNVKFCTILGFMIISLGGHAQSIVQSTGTSVLSKEAHSDVKPLINETTEILLRADSFISPDYNSTPDKTFGFVGVHYSNLDRAEGVPDQSTHLHSDITAAVSPQETILSFMNITQFYTDLSGLTMGRKKIKWSLLDERWHLGIYQPQFKWNPLLPESQGLTGFFIDLNNNDQTSLVGLRLFGSFLYLPDQGASYSVKNGSFQSVSPWFPQMPSKVQFDANGQVVNSIYWNIHQPDTQKVLFNSSYAAQLYYGDASYAGFSAQAAIAYKPTNQLALAANTTTMANPVTNVDIEPLVFFHTVTSADIRYNFGSAYVGVEALSEKPTMPENVSTNMSYRVYTDKQLLSSVVGYKSLNFDSSISFLKFQGEEESVTGSQVSYLKQYLPKRFSYGDSARADLGINLPKNIFNQARAEISYQAGMQNEYEMWSLNLKGKIKRNWSWNSQVVFVRAQEMNLAQNGAPTIYQQFQDNDLLSLGVNYVY